MAEIMDVEARYKEAVKRGDTRRAQQILNGQPSDPVSKTGYLVELPSSAPSLPPASALPPPSAPQAGAAQGPLNQVGIRYAPSTPAVPTPQSRRPQIDPRYWQAIQRRDPVVAGWINNAAQMFGVSPERLAYHKFMESGFNRTSPRGADNEIGVMQFMPATWTMIDPRHELNPANGQDAAYLAAKYIKYLDHGPPALGEDTPASVAAYNGSGPKARTYATYGFAGPSQISDKMIEAGPDAVRRSRAFMNPADFVAQKSSMTPRGLVQAAHQGGPDAALTYMVNTTPNTMPVSDKWQHAEMLLAHGFLLKGDVAGAAAARDFIGSMAHAGTNQHLMNAYKLMAAGQGQKAADELATAHAFFPDGTQGQFWSDGKNVYSKVLDEKNPELSHGATVVTPDAVAGLFNQTKDPQNFLANLTKRQESVAKVRQENAAAGYNEVRPALQQARTESQAQSAANATAQRADAAAQRTGVALTGQANQAAIAEANRQSAENRNATTQLNESARTNAQIAARGAGAKLSPEVQQALEQNYGTAGITDPDERDRRARGASFVAAGVRNGMGLQEIQMLEQGLRVPKGQTQGIYKLQRSSDGQTRVVTQDGRPVANLPPEAAAALVGPLAPQSSRLAVPQPPVLYTPGGVVQGVPQGVPQAAAPSALPAPAGPPGAQRPPVTAPNPFVTSQPQVGALGYGPVPAYSTPAATGVVYPPDEDEDERE